MTSSSDIRVICLIPARKGSKGVRRKNLRRVGLSTLVNRAIKIARQIYLPVHIILSSDDEVILKRYSKKVHTSIKRSPELSNDNALISQVVLDSLKNFPHFSDRDIFVLLEPSSPNRKSSDVNDALRLMIQHDYESLITASVVDAKYHPHKVLKLNHESLRLESFIPNSPKIANRQEIKEVALFRNGIAYLYRLSVVRALTDVMPDPSNFILTHRPVVNIDNECDLWLSRYIYFMDLMKLLKRR